MIAIGCLIAALVYMREYTLGQYEDTQTLWVVLLFALVGIILLVAGIWTGRVRRREAAVFEERKKQIENRIESIPLRTADKSINSRTFLLETVQNSEDVCT